MDNVRFPIFRERFSQLRGDMKQDEFAEFLGFSRPTVALYESGKRVPDAVALKTIAEKGGVSADWLLGIRDTTIKTADQLMNDICQYTGLRENAIETLHSSTAFSDGLRPALQISDVINYMLSDYGFADDIMDSLRRAFSAAHPAVKLTQLKEEIETARKAGYTLLTDFEAVDLYINLTLRGLYTLFYEMMEKPILEVVMNPEKGGYNGQHIEASDN